MKIDFVVPWVDGSDSEWQKEYSRYSGKPIAPERYRDWGAFKYWFRAIEKYAPWVNKIHLITCGQVPEWLNTEHPKLNLVFHEDYIPHEWLPTFSAHPIELNMHRISGLSEHFVYFNDDTYLSAPCVESDFFKNDLPCDQAIITLYRPDWKDACFKRILYNLVLVINKHFSKSQVMRNNLSGWFNLKYGRFFLYNIYSLPISWFPGLHIHHMPQPFLKTSLEEVWSAEGELLSETSSHRFRNPCDVNQYIFRFWQLCSGKFVPRASNVGAYFDIGAKDEEVRRCFLKHSKKMVCINDTMHEIDVDAEMKFLRNLFEKVFPEKSSFEK